jgi:hypothetical protein
MIAKLKRREFISLLGGALATPSLLWPRASCAQQPGGMRRIGWLLTLPRDHPEGQARIATFHKGLVAAGWIEGHNLRIEDRWSDGDADGLRVLAAELARLDLDAVGGWQPAAKSRARCLPYPVQKMSASLRYFGLQLTAGARGQAYRKHRSLAWLARDCHVAAHHTREFAADRKA